MDKRGGKREGAGRKSKAEEQKLVEKLSPLDDIAFSALENALKEDESWAVKLFMQYRYGMPKQVTEITNISDKSVGITKWLDDNSKQ